MKKALIIPLLLLGAAASGQGLRLNEFEVFEETGVSVLVYSNQYNGMFCDEKTAGVELIQHVQVSVKYFWNMGSVDVKDEANKIVSNGKVRNFNGVTLSLAILF